MSMPSAMFIPFTPQPHATEFATLGCLRDRVRSEVRTALDRKLVKLTGLPRARMSYTTDTYARLVVIRYGWKLVGWPKSVLFRNFSDIRGGAAPFLKLRSLWTGSKLKFVPATREDLANAARDPTTVHPCPEQLERANDASDGEDEDEGEDVLRVEVAPLVLHPVDLSIIGIHPTSTTPVPGERRRHQRVDTKRARRRPKTNPTNRRLRRPRPGVKSCEYILSDDEDGIPEPARKRTRYTLTDDPIDEFVERAAEARAADTDEIESASGDWI
ncbi:hypothetical protein OH77DRAFT_1421903 [Trametes cingulata]|nr:hypothetical protein OH77DRAFT_1421903 [Trametes cingulata]